MSLMICVFQVIKPLLIHATRFTRKYRSSQINQSTYLVLRCNIFVLKNFQQFAQGYLKLFVSVKIYFAVLNCSNPEIYTVHSCTDTL